MHKLCLLRCNYMLMYPWLFHIWCVITLVTCCCCHHMSVPTPLTQLQATEITNKSQIGVRLDAAAGGFKQTTFTCISILFKWHLCCHHDNWCWYDSKHLLYSNTTWPSASCTDIGPETPHQKIHTETFPAVWELFVLSVWVSDTYMHTLLFRT